MPKPKKHIFACAQSRPPGHPKGSCGERNCGEVINTMMQGIMQRGLMDVQLTTTGCLGPCHEGPNMIIYPEGIMYGGIKTEDVDRIIEQHLIGDKPVEELFVSKEIWS